MTRKENPLEELEKAYAQWESLYKQGGSDPFYPDGVNLNLVRNHILYFKRQIEETQPLYKNTEVYRRELPPQVEDSYMARQRKSAPMPKTLSHPTRPIPTTSTCSTTGRNWMTPASRKPPSFLY